LRINSRLSWVNYLTSVSDIPLKTLLTILLSLLIIPSLTAQYYLRGEVKDEMNNPLANAKILLHSTGYVYYCGGSGGFGIICNKPQDSVTVFFDGYQELLLKLESSRYEHVTLKLQRAAGNLHKSRLISFTKDMSWQERHNWSVGGETYSNLVENEFITSKKFPETGFAINTDKASYSNIRRFINMGSTVPPDAIRIEELLNYFNFGYKEPPKDSVFNFDSYLSTCPWNADNELLFLIPYRQVTLFF
jgi:Ca-activated chloride channel homolog